MNNQGKGQKMTKMMLIALFAGSLLPAFTADAGAGKAGNTRNSRGLETRTYKRTRGRWQPALSPGASLEDKLRLIKIPKIEFEEASPDVVFDYLSRISKTYDPDRKGVNIIHMKLNNSDSKITMNASHIPMLDVIKYVCMLADLHYQIDRYAVVIKPNVKKKK